MRKGESEMGRPAAKEQKKKTILFSLVTLLVLSFIFSYPVLFQEGNPIPLLKGMIRLSTNEEEIIKVFEEPLWYMSVTRQGNSPLVSLMEDEGWNFQEQLGAGHVFSRENTVLIVTSTQYTRTYTIWKFSPD